MQMRNRAAVWSAMYVVAMVAVSVGAADRYSSGTKAWDTTTANWGTVTGGGGSYNQAVWSNTTPDSAIFEGVAGTVTLTEAITNSGIRFDVAGYTITTNGLAPRLSFANDATIRCDVASATINPGIDGTAGITLTGTGSGTLASKMYGTPNVTKTGSGTWTWEGGAPYADGCSVGHVVINEGILKASGNIGLSYSRGLTLNSGGEFHYNAPNTLYSPDGNGRGWNMNGGALDNSSGAPIVSSGRWMGFSMNEDTVFIGSQGTNSDLRLNLIGYWTDGKKISVSNEYATLTLNGDSYAGGVGRQRGDTVVKGGAGTLKLTGNVTYTGDTIVEEGTLALGPSASGTNGLADSTTLRLAKQTMVSIDDGFNDTIEKLYIDGKECMAGTWGSRATDATYRWDLYFQGEGILTVTSGVGLIPILPGSVILVR
jgi:autotransporter-associated beta strand protein